MGNELVPVSLEQTQAVAIRTDLRRQAAFDDVTLYTAAVESRLEEAKTALEEKIPILRKEVDKLSEASIQALSKDRGAVASRMSKKYAGHVKALAKLGIRGVIAQAAVSDPHEGKYKVTVMFKQDRDRYCPLEMNLGTGDKPTAISAPVGKAYLELNKKLKEVTAKLAQTQEQLMNVLALAQDISRHERAGKALVIAKEREQTEEGREKVKFIQDAAEKKCEELLQNVQKLLK